MEQILSTKLYIPPPRLKLVTRPRLIKKIREGLHCKLTLISTPAGFGKTTAVSDWIKQSQSDYTKQAKQTWFSWLSLNENDNDLTRFLTYFIAALRQPKEIEDSLGEDALGMLLSPQPPSTKSILTSLINDLANLPGKIILVLDDYHLISGSPVNDALDFLIEYQPPQLHLVIVTRVDPQLPLARLRASSQLNELRAADLRFSSAEAFEFLNNVMELDLAEEEVTMLTSRTEGWIAGLQLAAISFRGNSETSHQIKSFTGSHHLVLDYLIEEVLEQQSEKVQTFLLQTAVLRRLTGSLCNAVTNQEDGQQTLEMLDHANLFLIPLDEERRWYRYHHLFADLLRRRLESLQSEQVSTLHQRASLWFEQAGFTDEAIDHALLAKDFSQAADLIEAHADASWEKGEHTKLRGWLEGLPEELVLSRPQFCIFQAWNLFASGQQDEAGKYLMAVEQADDSADNPASETKPGNQTSRSKLRVQGRASSIRAWMAAYRSDIPGIIQHSSKALEYLPEEDLIWRTVAAITLGDAYFLKGEYDAGYTARMDALDASKSANNFYLLMNVSVKLALNLKAQGRLKQIIDYCQRRLDLAKRNGMDQTAVVGWLLSVWGEVLAETDQLEEALALARKGMELTERGGDVAMLGWSYLCMTRVYFSKGAWTDAEEILQKLENISKNSTVPIWIMNLKTVWQTRLWLVQNKLELTANWVRASGLNPVEEPSNVAALEYIALVRVLIAQGRSKETLPLLQHLLDAAEAGGNVTRAIEVLILQALAFQARNEEEEAINKLEKAFSLAEPRGFLRIFVDEGPQMGKLLHDMAARKVAPVFASRLLAAFQHSETKPGELPQKHAAGKDLIEPLSDRELEILHLVAEGLTNRELASRLYLSVNTVKVHIRNIYSKLGVSNRMQAAARAKALGILSTD